MEMWASSYALVPNATSITQSAAETAITSANLTVGPVTREFSATVPAGSVISHVPAAGETVSAGSQVSLVVSKGPARILTIVPTGQGSVSPASGGEYETGTEVMLTATPAGGWRFARWEGSLTGTVNPSTLIMNGDRSVTAVFTQQFTLATATQGNGSLVGLPSGNLHDAGTQVTLSATPTTGWRFVRWEGDLSGISNPAQITMDEFREVTAIFYPVAPSLAGMTEAGARAAVEAAGFVVGAVSQAYHDTVPAGRVVRQSPDADGAYPPGSSIALVISKGPGVLLEAEVVGQGSVTPPGDSEYETGSVVTVTAVAASGWRFDHWEGDVAGFAAQMEITMNGDRRVVAVFIRLISLAYTAGVGGSVSGNLEQVVDIGEDGTAVTAQPDTGYRFLRWSDNRTDNPRIDAGVTADILATALFVQVPVAAFTASPRSGLVPLSVTFTDISSPGTTPIQAWSWSFGDDASSVEQNPLHIYSAPGRYTVSLKVNNDLDESVETKTAYILAARYNIPNLVGMTEAQAQSALVAMGLSLGAVTLNWSAEIAAGLIISQGVTSGLTSEAITSVPVTVSRGLVTHAYSYGDVNMDGIISSTDYGAMLRAQTGTDPVARALSDVNQDGLVDSKDTQLLLRYLRSGGIVSATVRRVMAQAGSGEVLLLWGPIPHDNVALYRVYRSSDAIEPRVWTLLGETSETVYVDSAVESKRYYYKVSFVDILGNEGGHSMPAEVLANTVVMNVPTVWGEPGSTVRVPINLGNARGLTPKDMFISLEYDADRADFVSVKPTALTANVDFMADTAGGGIVNILSQDSQSSLTGGEGRFFDLYFTLHESLETGCAPVILSDAILTNSQGSVIPIQTGEGSLCVGAGTWGDLDGSGDVTEADAVIALEIAVEKLSLEPDDERNLFGDMNGDGMIDAADAVMILRMARSLSINPETNEKNHTKQYTPRQLTLGQTSAPKGCVVTMPVSLDNIAALAGMDIIVSFPRQDLECVAVRTTDSTSDFKIESQLAPGYARISLSEAEALSDGAADVIELDFLVMGDVTSADKPASIIKLNYAELKGELGESFRWYTDIARSNGQVTILPAASCPGDQEGAAPEGSDEGTSPEGQNVEGLPAEGQRPEGTDFEGETLEGQSPEGEAPAEGELTDGEPVDGTPAEGAKPEGETPAAAAKGCFSN